MKFTRNIVLCIIVLVVGMTKNSFAEESPLPFAPGEKLTFELKWSFMTAGTAVLEVLPIETINGVEVFHFVMTAETTPFLDIFYKVRDRIDAYADVHMTRSILFKKKQREGRSFRDIMITFDWEKNQAQYSNFGNKRDPVDIDAGAFDPLSAFYYTRMIDFKENTVIERPITDGKSCVTGKASIKGRETIETKIGNKETYIIEPELKHVGGVFEKSKNATIRLWMSADKKKIPLRIESQVAVGNFLGELISAEGL